MKCIILVHNGFEEAEMVVPADIMRRAGIETCICSMTGKKKLIGSKSIEINADTVWNKSIDVENVAEEFDAVMLPGGGPNAFALKDDERVCSVVKAFNEKGKIVAAICAAPIVLEKMHITDGKNITSYTGMLDASKCIYHENAKAVRDGNIITACGPAACLDFGYALAEALAGAETADKLKKEMLY